MTTRVLLVAFILSLGQVASAEETEPGANAATVMQTIRVRVPMLAICAKKKQRGDVVASFTVSETGAVQDLALSGTTFGGPEVPACVKQQIAAWTFAALETPADFELPIHFTDKGIVLGDRGGGAQARPAEPKKVVETTESPSQSGGLMAAQVQDVVKQHQKEVQACYRSAVARKPDLSGRVVLALRILGSGQVASSTVKTSTLADDVATACMAERARAWVFSASSGVTNVEFPFVFKP